MEARRATITAATLAAPLVALQEEALAAEEEASRVARGPRASGTDVTSPARSTIII